MYKVLLLILIILVQPSMVLAQVNIWEGTSCRAKVELIAYPTEGKNNTAVIICPGGSYFWLDHNTEGRLVAQWLQENNISAFVLHYRTAGVFAFITHFRYLFRGHRYPDAQDDLQQAIHYIKTHADEYGISQDNIGVMGFSAGGHLVMSSVELFNNDYKPSFVAAIYPVVTMDEECVHKRSRRALLGDNKKRNKHLRDSLSLEKHIPDNCPPIFLVNCKDDPIVKYHNSELLDSALTIKNIPHCYIQYNTGGHGFGASDTKGTEESRTWKEEFLKWLSSLDDI